MQYFFLQHWTLLSPPDTSTHGHHFCFGSTSSFFLEVFLCSFPVAYWTPTNLGCLSFSVISVCLFILFMGFSWQEYWSGLPSPSLVNHNLSSPNCQRYFLQPLHVDGWHARHPGCPTAGPRWVCKPSPAAGCWSICNLWAKAEALHHIVGNTDFVISHFPFFILFSNQHIFQLSVMLHIHFITIVTLEIYQSRGFESYSSHNLLCF